MSAIVFPGQGAQRPGMFRDWYERSPLARETFDLASKLLDFDVRAVCFEEDPRIDRTDYTQPAIFVGEMAMFRALEGELQLRGDYFGGHSLGEYTALTAAGVIPFDVAVRLVRQRGRLMEEASPQGAGGMLAVTLTDGAGFEDVEHALTEAGLNTASFNTRSQRVFAGSLDALARAEASLERWAERCSVTRLNVSAPFHCALMQPVQDALKVALTAVADSFDVSRAPQVVSNTTGTWHLPERAQLVESLARQVTAPVLWEHNMSALAAAAEQIVEVGPSRPLSGFFRSIQRRTSAVVTFQGAGRGLCP